MQLKAVKTVEIGPESAVHGGGLDPVVGDRLAALAGPRVNDRGGRGRDARERPAAGTEQRVGAERGLADPASVPELAEDTATLEAPETVRMRSVCVCV